MGGRGFRFSPDLSVPPVFLLFFAVFCGVFCFFLKIFHAVIQRFAMRIEKFLKKVLAGNGKGCTFAPAKREGEDT